LYQHPKIMDTIYCVQACIALYKATNIFGWLGGKFLFSITKTPLAFVFVFVFVCERVRERETTSVKSKHVTFVHEICFIGQQTEQQEVPVAQ
jgi:hypothetical protein